MKIRSCSFFRLWRSVPHEILLRGFYFFCVLALIDGSASWAAVSRQSTVPASVTTADTLTSVSWSHTVNAGSDLLLVVGVSIDNDNDYPSGVTYNGVAMTNIANQAVSNGSFGASSAWQLVNPATGANTVQVTYAIADTFGANSISFSGVDQASPIGDIDQNTSSSASWSPTLTTTSGDYVFVVTSSNNDVTQTVTTGSEEWDDNSNVGAHTTAALSSIASGSLTGVAWTWSSAETNSYIAFTIQQSTLDVDQEGYRFRNDDGNETTATWLANQDTAITQPLATNTRLRVLVDTSADPSSAQYQLEYKKSTESTYKKVEVPSGSAAFGSAGASVSGTTSVSVPYPASISAGDLLVLGVANKYPNNGPTTPTGWRLLSNCQGSGGQGASGADTGSTYATIFVKEADGTESGNLSVTITSGNSAVGAMVRYTKGAGKNWNLACTNGSDNSGNSTSWSVTGAADPGLITDDIVVVVSAINTDAYTFASQALTSTGVTFSSDSERYDDGTTSGQDCKLVGTQHVVSGGTSSAAPVFTMTASGSTTNRPAGASSFLRIRQVDQPIQLSSSANIAASGENTTAQLTAPVGKTTSDFVTGRMQDDENPADAIDITSNDYTELEWSMVATSNASNGEIYTFRVTNSGSLFSTYTVTPQWTIGSGGTTGPQNSSSFLSFD